MVTKFSAVLSALGLLLVSAGLGFAPVPAPTKLIERSSTRHTLQSPDGENYQAEIFKDVVEVPRETYAVTAGECRSYVQGITIYNNAGGVSAAYSQKTDWCYDGSNITYVAHVETPSVQAPLWVYSGIVNHNHWGGLGQTSYRAYSQAYFCQAVPVYGCTWNVYPWVDQTVGGNGAYGGGGDW